MAVSTSSAIPVLSSATLLLIGVGSLNMQTTELFRTFQDVIPLGLPPFGFLGFLSVVSVCVSLVFCCFYCAPSRVWESPALSGLVIGSYWLPSLSVVTSPSPSVGPVWRPGPVFTLVLPSGYLVAALTAQLLCLCAGSVAGLCRPSFILSHGSKGS